MTWMRTTTDLVNMNAVAWIHVEDVDTLVLRAVDGSASVVSGDALAIMEQITSHIRSNNAARHAGDAERPIIDVRQRQTETTVRDETDRD